MHLPYKAFHQVIAKWIDTLINEVKFLPFLNPYLPKFSDPPNLENVRSHSSNSNENATL